MSGKKRDRAGHPDEGPNAKADPRPTDGSERVYPSTLWTTIRRFQLGGPDAEAALETLLERYRGVIAARFHKCGFPEPDQCVQEFISKRFLPRLLAKADPTKGRFRGFLGKALTWFILDEIGKRGRDRLGQAAPLDTIGNDSPSTALALSPEKIEFEMDRALAIAIVGRAFSKLRDQYAANGREDAFKAFEGAILGTSKERYAEIAHRLGTTEGTIKVDAHKFRRALRDRIMREVRDLVPEGEGEDEAKYLLSLFQRNS